MAKKSVINLLPSGLEFDGSLGGTTNFSATGGATGPTTTGASGASGTVGPFGQFTNADAAVFYIDGSGPTGAGAVTFTIQEEDPNNGSFHTITGTTGISTASTTRVVLDPVYGQAFQLVWSFTGGGSINVSASAILSNRTRTAG